MFGHKNKAVTAQGKAYNHRVHDLETNPERFLAYVHDESESSSVVLLPYQLTDSSDFSRLFHLLRNNGNPVIELITEVFSNDKVKPNDAQRKLITRMALEYGNAFPNADLCEILRLGGLHITGLAFRHSDGREILVSSELDLQY